MWIGGFILIIVFFLFGDTEDKIRSFFSVLRSIILVGSFILNPILGIIVFIIWQYIKSKIL